MKVYVTNPHGYCLGVINAISEVTKLRKNNPTSKIYIFGMLVHNKDVKDYLENKDIITISDTSDYRSVIDSLEKDSFLVFTAHGHQKEIEDYALSKGLKVIDTTCPRVKENLNLIIKELNEGNDVIYIGKNNHPETIAALSLGKNVYLYEQGKDFDYNQLKSISPLVINQTTLSHLDLIDIHKDIVLHLNKAKIVDEICDATKVRQIAVKNIPSDVSLIIIVGGKESSNTLKLYEIAKKTHPNAKVIKILNITELNKNDLIGHNYVAVASGTSTPIEVTNKIISYLKLV